MKTIMLILFLLFCWNCKENVAAESESKLSVKLTAEQEEVIKSMYSFIDSMVRTKSCSVESFSEFSAVAGKEMAYLPLYHLNWRNFSKNPVPENILPSLELPEEQMHFVVEENGKVLNVLTAEKLGDGWRPYGITSGMNTSKPIFEMMRDSQKTDWIVFMFLGSLEYSYLYEGERYYVYVNGEVRTEEKMCEHIMHMINLINEAEMRGEELYF